MACKYDAENPPRKFCGTLVTLSPEVLLGKAYDKKVDCWSLGIILYEMLSGVLPFYSDRNDELVNMILDQPLDEDMPMSMLTISDEAFELITKLLDRDSTKRLSIKEALSHDWFKDVDLIINESLIN